VLAELEQEKGMLERKIEELRGFERTYRSQLKSYLQSQLEDLDQTGVEPAEDVPDEVSEGAEHSR